MLQENFSHVILSVEITAKYYWINDADDRFNIYIKIGTKNDTEIEWERNKLGVMKHDINTWMVSIV